MAVPQISMASSPHSSRPNHDRRRVVRQCVLRREQRGCERPVVSGPVVLPDALAVWLAGCSGVSSGDDGVHLEGGERPGAGQSNDTVLFTASWMAPDGPHRRELVLRRQPNGQQIFLTPDVIREANVLIGLERGGLVPVPHVLGYETDPELLGGAFFVMERVRGRVPLARPSIHSVGFLPTLTASQRRVMWDSALDVLIAVHATDWPATHAFLLDGAAPAGALDRHLDRLVEWYRWTTQQRGFPVTDAALERLVADRGAVGTDDSVLVWGDSRVGNMIFGDDHRVAAAIDWEVATIGPAAIDVAHWLFFDDFATTASGIEPLAGWPDRATTLAEYEARSGRTLRDLWYFELMEEFFMATTLIRQADFRVANGLAVADTRMGHDNAVTQMLARRLGLPVPNLSPDYIAHRSGVAADPDSQSLT